MTIGTIDPSQRKAAKVAGLAYLLSFALVVYVNFGIHDKLIVVGNIAETARNILAHQRLFRIGIAGDLAYCWGIVVLIAALYVILRPVDRGLALLAAFLRLVWVLMWLAWRSISLTFCGFYRAPTTCGHRKLSDCRTSPISILRLVPTTITLACCSAHPRRRSAATCGSSLDIFLDPWPSSA